MSKRRKRPTKAEWDTQEYMREIKKDVRQKIKAEKDALYNSVSLETRQRFIQLCHERGGKVVDVGREAGIEDPKAAVEIWLRNHKKVSYRVLKQPDEVK